MTNQADDLSTPASLLRQRYRRSLAGASVLHISVGIARIVSAEYVRLVRSFCSIDDRVAADQAMRGGGEQQLFQLQQQEEMERYDEERRYYASFLVLYGIVLGMYSSFGSRKIQKFAIGIESFRVCCYVFVTTIDEFGQSFNFHGEQNNNGHVDDYRLFAHQLWKLIGILGLLGNICGLHDGK